MHTNLRSYLILLLLSLLVLGSCSVKKFIPEDELLYTGADLQVETDSIIKNKDDLKSELEGVLKPEPNTKILGMRPGLYFHYKAQKKNPGFINKFLNKKIGEEPVYLSQVETQRTEDILRNRLENRGFFYSAASSAVTKNEEAKTANIQYSVKVPSPYRLETYQLDQDSLLVYKEIKKLLADSPLEKGMRFDLPTLKLERERLDNKLKRKGYYNFNPTFLIFETDTNQYSNKKFDLFLRLKKDVPEKSIIPYKIARVNVYPNYGMEDVPKANDTLRYSDLNFIRETNEEFFKAKYLEPYILLEEGDLFDPENSRNTSRRLTSIGIYKFVNIRYDEIDTLATDSLGILEANIFLSPLNKRAVRAELQAVTKSNDFAGPSLALTYSNRNLFRGGEILNVSGKFGYEVQVGGGSQAGLNSIQLGVETDLIVPRLLFPIKVNDNFFKYSIPKTKISLGADYLNRSQLFSLGSVSARFGYYWDANRYVTHELNPISLNYVKLGKTSEEFDEILRVNPFVRNSFDQQFIAGITYSFTYNGLVEASKTHQFFLNNTIEFAGNTISLLNGSSGEEGQEFLGLEYAQFGKASLDFSYHLRLGNQQKLVSRLFGGIGIPYGNSDIMPFTKQFFAGGPYSVRAFNTRSLGPGTYSPERSGNTSYFDQSGNLRLEANVEYRFPIYSFFKGALFADAGNVWNTEDNAVPIGKFSSNFINELGIGAGAGLRVDIQSFVIRFDLAFPMHDPSKIAGDRWDINLKKPVLNFAIGYPF